MLKRVSLGWTCAALLAAPVLAKNPTVYPVRPEDQKQSLPSHEPIQFNATPLSDCVSYIQDISGINISVDWKALEAANISRDTPITLHLSSSVTLGKTLKLTLQQAAGAGVLTSYAEDGVLNITTQAAEDKLLITRVYPIQDLLFQPPDYTNAPQLDINSIQNTSAGGSGGGGGGQSNIFGGSSSSSNTNTQTTQTDRANNIIKMVTDTIRPELWKVNGGDCTIEYLRGSLIVHAPRSVHRQLSSQYVSAK